MASTVPGRQQAETWRVADCTSGNLGVVEDVRLTTLQTLSASCLELLLLLSSELALLP